MAIERRIVLALLTVNEIMGGIIGYVGKKGGGAHPARRIAAAGVSNDLRDLGERFPPQPLGDLGQAQTFPVGEPDSVLPHQMFISRQRQLFAWRLTAGKSRKRVAVLFYRSRGEEEPSTSSARTVAAPRVSTPSFSNISCTCFLTVDSVMPRIVAMSGFVLP
jgi:hypothetical protein